jgi:hypothetical protein
LIAEGKLLIDLRDPVRISSNRTAPVSALLKGRKVADVLTVLPMVYSLCGHAHAAAARLATGQGGTDLRLVLAENAREHLLRILLGWKAGGTPMPAPPIMALVGDMEKAIKHRDTGAVAARLDAYLETCVFSCPPEDFLAGAPWLHVETQAATYLRLLKTKGWQNLGSVEPAPLPVLEIQELTVRMKEDGFCATPEWQGLPRETGPFARQAGHDLVKNCGTGLMARLMARLVELAQIPAQMRAATPINRRDGFGVIETARGRLVHMARIRDGRIAEYRILAPTEWNFHPKGVAAQALKGLDVAQAKAVIEAIDPCVDYELRAA